MEIVEVGVGVDAGPGVARHRRQVDWAGSDEVPLVVYFADGNLKPVASCVGA